ncbi:glycosyl transferase family 1 [Humitalea rosea]|uniref:Glycosyl transferase family 1 n=1 Tax=Humitalea rosea TaxID=990373 RepID=A0A2W7IG05_9PROT|nr:glycosyltransferase family 4 protein [Humitalea rosea]PZW45886.1 glycosyl transferase family 1 [Humitalea rosea]
MPAPIALLVPGPFDAISGGYVYDRRIVAGLRADGREVAVIELAGHHPLPDAAAEDFARATLAAIPAGTRIVVDGLGLPAFAPVVEDLVARGAVGLIHHPTALETGFAEADRAALKAREQAIFPRLAGLITTSRLTASRLPDEFAVDPARVTIVEPGTDPAPRSTGSGGPGCAILSIGTLVPRKGHDVLLRALGRLTDLDWSLTIVGAPRDTAHADGLVALAEELGLTKRVTFAGEVDEVGIEALYAKADLFALATHWEGYGMVAAEALARGLPLAITAGGAIADLATQGTAIVAPVGDADSLSRGMRRAILDPLLRANMAKAAWTAGQGLPRWSDRAALFAAALDAAA